MAMIQDFKHRLKTDQNNLFTGVKLFPLGSHITMYSYVRDMAFGAKSSLCHRDVEKTDGQDNNASTCVHSAASMVYLAKHHEDHLGLIIYLFIFGELINAYQNRKIPHIECIKMALHARFFIDMWHSFLKAAGYTERIH